MLNQNQVNKVLGKKVPNLSPSRVAVLAIRGNDGHNDLGVFDDRCYVVYDHALKGSWLMNTDPSNQKPGRATLKTGVWRMIAKKHHIASPPPKGRPAFGQAQAVTVHRHDRGDDTGWFGINIHDSLGGTTSSEGCQTFLAEDWHREDGSGFRDVMYRLLKVTPEGVMAHPDGFGPEFLYILIDAVEVAHILAQG